MVYFPTLISIIEVLLVTVPVLLTVAFVTVAERKTMASMQRRLGPNIVGYYGLLQAFADALKLLLKEYRSRHQQKNHLLVFQYTFQVAYEYAPSNPRNGYYLRYIDCLLTCWGYITYGTLI